jgi:RNA polymerase sigma-70 factor (ECF subfamily)
MPLAQDNELVIRIRKGDRLAETELVSRFHGKIREFVYYMVKADSADLEDVISEVLLTLLVNLRAGKYDLGRGTTLSSYIYGIAKNKIKEYLRSKKKWIQKSTILINGFAVSLNNMQLENEELEKLLKYLISKLDPKYKKILYLRYYEGLSVKDISVKLNLPARRVSERIHYALKLLYKQCKKRKYFSIFREFFSIYVIGLANVMS